MKKPRHHVTDHAFVRYLERVEGIDVESMRRAIGQRVDAVCEGHDGMCSVLIDGMRYILENGKVITVQTAHDPIQSRAGVGRGKG